LHPGPRSASETRMAPGGVEPPHADSKSGSKPGGGIRTLGPGHPRAPVFQTGPISHSGTPLRAPDTGANSPWLSPEQRVALAGPLASSHLSRLASGQKSRSPGRFSKRTTGFERATLSLGSLIGRLTGKLGKHGKDVSASVRARLFPYFPVRRYHWVTTEPRLERVAHAGCLRLGVEQVCIDAESDRGVRCAARNAAVPRNSRGDGER
jgi:hypothetical protein